jgi:hypothetical protein
MDFLSFEIATAQNGGSMKNFLLCLMLAYVWLCVYGDIAEAQNLDSQTLMEGGITHGQLTFNLSINDFYIGDEVASAAWVKSMPSGDVLLAIIDEDASDELGLYIDSNNPIVFISDLKAAEKIVVTISPEKINYKDIELHLELVFDNEGFDSFLVKTCEIEEDFIPKYTARSKKLGGSKATGCHIGAGLPLFCCAGLYFVPEVWCDPCKGVSCCKSYVAVYTSCNVSLCTSGYHFVPPCDE